MAVFRCGLVSRAMLIVWDMAITRLQGDRAVRLVGAICCVGAVLCLTPAFAQDADEAALDALLRVGDSRSQR